MRSFRVAMIGALLAAAPVAAAHAEVRVVASIKPIHSLVAGVMAGVGSPSLIVEGAGSPHTYSLKPSQAAAIESADVIFWVGHNLEAFLEKPLDSLGGKARVVELMDTDGLTQLAIREGGPFEGHDHDHSGHGHDDDHDHDHAKKDHDDHGHGEAKHDDHDHDHDHDAKKHDDHGHEEAKHDDHDHDHDAEKHDDHGHEEAKHDDHGHHGEGEVDAHIWLDPMNAKVLIGQIVRSLSEADQANAAAYKANADALAARIEKMSAEVAEKLAPVRERPFIVFHDAYQHFESRYGLRAAGSITVSPEVVPGAARVQEIRERIRDLGAVCVFSEPQFTPQLVSVVTEGSNANEGVLDPLGAALTPGPDLYVTLIENLADNMAECLTARS